MQGSLFLRLILFPGIFLIAACSADPPTPTRTPRPTNPPLVERTFGTTVPELCNSAELDESVTDAPGDSRLAILASDGSDIHKWYDDLPNNRKATSASETDLILCVETPPLPTGGFSDPPSARAIELCEYEFRSVQSSLLNRVNLSLYNIDYSARLIDAQTQNLLAEGEISYPDERAICPESVQVQDGQTTVYVEVPIEFVVAWVDDQVSTNVAVDEGESAADEDQEPTPPPEGFGLSADLPVLSNADWSPLERAFDDVEMVLVPTGCFMMGMENSGMINSEPVHEQCFEEPFWIDRFEVTNAQFENFDGVADRESRWPEPNRPRERVTWFEARDYCALRDARLPTEAEWEYAARGPDNLVHPWGDAQGTELVVHAGQQGGETMDVGSLPDGASWVGAHNMGGNVNEWVSSLYIEYPYSPASESDDDPETMHIVRGGNYWAPYSLISNAIRFNISPDVQYDYNGIRCVRDYDD